MAMPRTLSEIMTRDVTSCSPEATIQQVARIMADRNVGSVPVTAAGRLVGMVTDRDIAVRAVARGADPRSETIAPYITRDVETATPDTAVDEAVQLMEERQVRRLPVVEGNRLVGIVSLGDLATRTPEPAGERDRMAGEALEAISTPSRPE